MFFKENGFSFLYGGEPAECKIIKEESETAGKIIHHKRYFSFKSLLIIQTIDEYIEYNAFFTRLKITNNSSENSLNISELNDFDYSFELEDDIPRKNPAYYYSDPFTKIVTASGSSYTKEEFYPQQYYIEKGQKHCFSCIGGRSSHKYLPFFEISKGSQGVMLAVGWSGQWFADFTRGENCVRTCFGVENADFYLKPSESIETVAALFMTYDEAYGSIGAHNKFKRLIKAHFSLIGQKDRAEFGPLCVSAWGGLPSDAMIDRIKKFKKHNLDFEYYWIDAGWYGDGDGDCPDEFTGDWYKHAGTWTVNKHRHPDGFSDVSKNITEAGMKFLLWIEPERALSQNEFPIQHPEWFFRLPDDNSESATLLLNMGNSAAVDYIVELVSGYIEKLNIKCFREDYNLDPLDFWRKNDEQNRAGMNEIKCINGFYEFWDRLLLRFPDLIIDNCASGGRRIDIMTIKRSIPLWRSDYMCNWNFSPESAQIQNCGINWWLPYSGTGSGEETGDTYRTRSCYSSAMSFNCWGYGHQDFDESDENVEWINGMIKEYKRARPFFSCDFYPLSYPTRDDSNWCVQCYDSPETGEGMILAFRRPDSLSDEIIFPLYWLNNKEENVSYSFEDVDTGITEIIKSDILAESGFSIRLTEKRSSKLIFYRKS